MLSHRPVLTFRLIPISNYLLPAIAPNAPVAAAPFKRPEPLKRSSLPFTSSAPGSPIREEPIRSPSPETIARMSMMSITSPIKEVRTVRDNAVPERKEPSLPSEAEARPRSPKPEADGKLDRRVDA